MVWIKTRPLATTVGVRMNGTLTMRKKEMEKCVGDERERPATFMREYKNPLILLDVFVCLACMETWGVCSIMCVCLRVLRFGVDEARKNWRRDDGKTTVTTMMTTTMAHKKTVVLR